MELVCRTVGQTEKTAPAIPGTSSTFQVAFFLQAFDRLRSRTPGRAVKLRKSGDSPGEPVGPRKEPQSHPLGRSQATGKTIPICSAAQMKRQLCQLSLNRYGFILHQPIVAIRNHIDNQPESR